jgi:PadR family transcriptional regulator PadR
MGRTEPEKTDVLRGTLVLLVLRTLDLLGPLHGYAIGCRIGQISTGLLQLNQGTLYPALLQMVQEGWITSKWAMTENNRRAKFYAITSAGKKHLARITGEWKRMASTIERFLEPLKNTAEERIIP